jgi:phosphotransferase system enzyme I (PtsI)
MIILKGIPASQGIAAGEAYLLRREELSIQKKKISERNIPQEITRFEDALIKTRLEILEIQKKMSKEIGVKDAEIFNAHLLVLEDRSLIEDVIMRLKKEKLCIEYIFYDVLKKYIGAFTKMEDEYLKERISDISDVGKRILKNLLGKEVKMLSDVRSKAILIAYDLSPSDTAMIHKKNIIAFATDIGGKTSHTAIMAKSLEIPAVVGLQNVTAFIEEKTKLIVDGTSGMVIINPTRAKLEEYRKKQLGFGRYRSTLLKLKRLPSVTKDGAKVTIHANIESPEEASAALTYGAEGIGLYRTEFFYLNRNDLPSEEEHYNAYRKVAEKLAPRPVVVRTLDLGGDKFLSQLKLPRDMNPFMGWRAIRFCLACPDIFKRQLRAILRAAVVGNLKIMYPLISGIDELRQANKLLEETKEELRSQRIPFKADIDVGVMIEVPSAAIIADILAKEADFFSIGTNDLIQYSLAVDRVNEKIAYLYKPTHPAILRLIKLIVEMGHKENIAVSMCGEVAGEPILIPLLLGFGLDTFSVSPSNVLKVKHIIRSLTTHEARDIARTSLNFSTSDEIEKFLFRKLQSTVPDLSIYDHEKLLRGGT